MRRFLAALACALAGAAAAQPAEEPAVDRHVGLGVSTSIGTVARLAAQLEPELYIGDAGVLRARFGLAEEDDHAIRETTFGLAIGVGDRQATLVGVMFGAESWLRDGADTPSSFAVVVPGVAREYDLGTSGALRLGVEVAVGFGGNAEVAGFLFSTRAVASFVAWL